MPSGGFTVLPRPRRRSFLVAAALALVAVLGAGSAWAVRAREEPAGTPGTATVASPAATQRTLLVALDDGADRIVAAALVAADSSSGVCVLVPGGLRLAGLPEGHDRVADAVSSGGPRLQDVLGGALQVRIDATWRLSPEALASVVDAEGGLVVDVDREVLAGDEFVAAGPGQRLTGSQAAAYAAALGEAEPEQARLARFGAVVSGVIQGLPEGEDRVSDLVGPLTGASLTVRAAAAGDLLHAVRGADGSGLACVVLPVVSESSQAASYTLDEAAVSDLVRSRLPGAQRPVAADGVARVLVRNGQGTPGLSDAARQRLRAVGLRVTGSGNADSFTYLTSEILVPSGSAADVRAGRQVAVALGLDEGSVTVADLGTASADVVVVLGEDFAQDVLDRGVLGRQPAASTP